jgi:hypothetical protein
MIYKKYKTVRRHARDPMAGVLKHLLEHKNSPATTLQILRLYNEFTQEGQTEVYLDAEPDRDQPDSTIGNNKKQYVWRLSSANQRR